MFGKKFFSTVALSGATVGLVGSVGSFAEQTVKVVGNKEIIEDDELGSDYVLYLFDCTLKGFQYLLERGEITEREMAESREKIEKIREDFLNNNYVDLDSLSSLDLESIFKESDYFYTTEKGYKFSSAYILGKYKGKKMLGIVIKTEDGRCSELHAWIV